MGLFWNHNHELCHITFFRQPKRLFWSYFVPILAKFYRKFGISESSQFKFARNRPVLTSGWRHQPVRLNRWRHDIPFSVELENFNQKNGLFSFWGLIPATKKLRIFSSLQFFVLSCAFLPLKWPSKMTVDDVMVTHSNFKSDFSRLILTRESLFWDINYLWDYPREWMLLDWLYLCGDCTLGTSYFFKATFRADMARPCDLFEVFPVFSFGKNRPVLTSR